jgi:hypothetical protein
MLIATIACYFEGSTGSTDINISNHDDLYKTDVYKKISQISISECDDDNECKTIEQTFNKQGLKISEIEYNNDGSLDTKKIYVYNDSMQLLSYEKYDDKNKLDDKEVYAYDSIDRIVEIKDLNGRGKIDRTIAFYYSDSTGQLVKTVQFDKYKSVEFTNKYFDYDQYKNFTRVEVYNDNDSLIDKIEKKYEYYK